MEVGVRVESEDTFSGDVRHTNSAYFVMVALDEDGKPCDVRDLEPSTDDARRRQAEAEERHRQRQ
jgi:acyl-CoA hydrolase